MSDDSLARSHSAALSSADADYDAIHATIVATERGRWFLDQYAQHYRGADTERVLAAIARVEQAIRGDSGAHPAETVPSELAAILETIEQTRDDLVARHGDPAASAEAAIADFRNAADQIQQLILGAHGRDSELGAQLSFQINRLASAGERLERSVGGLRTVLGLLEAVDQRLRRQAPGPEADVADPPPLARAEAAASPIEWSWLAGDADAESLPASEPPLPDATLVGADAAEPPSQPDTEHAGAFWDLTVDRAEPDRGEAEASADAPSEAGITDWAFAPADEPGHDTASPPGSPPAAPPVSALERLEAREYGRRPVATAVAPPMPPHEAPAPRANAPERPSHGGLDDLVLGDAPAGDDESDTPASEPPPDLGWTAEPTGPPEQAEPAGLDWSVEPTAAMPATEPMFDADLFDSAGDAAAATPEAAVSAAEAGADPQDDDAAEPGQSRPSSFLDDMTGDPVPDDLPAIAPERETAHDQWRDEPRAEPLAHETRLPALPPWPDPVSEATPAEAATVEPQVAAADAGADMPSVLQRLESMRTAIAALMDEVSDKTARRNPRS